MHSEVYAGGPPSKALMALECIRAVHELGAFAMTSHLLSAKEGDGHPVLVLPGLLADDASTHILRAELRKRRYRAEGWVQGRNYGLRAGVEKRMLKQIERMHDASSARVSIVGWSLGGLYARQLAKMVPHLVRSVITLGSPFAGEPSTTNANWIYRTLNPAMETTGRYLHPAGPLEQAPPVPCTAIYSRSDGVCAWQSCREQTTAQSESIEVYGSHIGLGHNPAVLHAVFDRLAQPEGEWRPFERSVWNAIFFPRVD